MSAKPLSVLSPTANMFPVLAAPPDPELPPVDLFSPLSPDLLELDPSFVSSFSTTAVES